MPEQPRFRDTQKIRLVRCISIIEARIPDQVQDEARDKVSSITGSDEITRFSRQKQRSESEKKG